MSDLRYIKPAQGLTIHGPALCDGALPAHGKGVEWNSYWQRRLDQGDVVETTEAAVRKAEAATAKTGGDDK
ncbi:DUF2635 domain-containing protein [Sphingomonas sp. HMWF008]|nr:DUF2635 domain-containing protein [Sphingomonas sp. HMWF008]